jgi:uncharacterized NAD(P)/FAD-binding protein YdhS
LNQAARVLFVERLRLTAIDLVNTIKLYGHKGKVHFINRSGVMSNVRLIDSDFILQHLTYEKVFVEAKRNDGSVSLRWVLRALRKDMKLVNKNWRKEIFPKKKPDNFLEYFNDKVTKGKSEPNRAFDVLRLAQPIIGEAWGRMPERDRLFFNSKYLNQWLSSRVYTPMLNGDRINKILQNGQLEIHGGIESIIKNSEGSFVAHFKGGIEEQYEFIVNGSGSAMHVQRDNGNRLICDLIDKGYSQIEPCGGVKVNFENGSLIDQYGYEDNKLRLVGHMAFGRYFLINNLPPLQKTTAIIANDLKQIVEGLSKTKNQEILSSEEVGKVVVFNKSSSTDVITLSI